MGVVIHIAGARPNFPKLAPVMAALQARGVPQSLVHTGQHYDDSLSDAFFRDLSLPQPDFNLEIGSDTHARQTAALMIAIEECFTSLKPALVLVYGDVNSTLAAALVAAKLQIPVGHVESGLRSFDWSMPEEVNRRVTDVVSDLLFATSPDAMLHLGREGQPAERVHLVGNTMIDSLLFARPRFDESLAASISRSKGPYAVVTLHRPSNVDGPGALTQVVAMLQDLSELIHLVFPVHPRGRAGLERAGLRNVTNLTILEPQPYLTFMGLLSSAHIAVTDSGGLQEETTILDVPCLTLRANTERPVTITHGTNQLVTPNTVLLRAREILEGRWVAPRERPPLWDGHAGERIASIVQDFLRAREGRVAE